MPDVPPPARPEHEQIAGARRRGDWAAEAMKDLASPPRDRAGGAGAAAGAAGGRGAEAKAKVWVLCELRRVIEQGGVAAAATAGLVAPPAALPLCADGGASPPASPQRYRMTLGRAVDGDCESILALLDQRVLPAVTAPDARCFFRLMAAANAAALRQCTEGARRRDAAARAAAQYAVAAAGAAADLPPRDPLRLLCALRRAEFLTDLGRDRAGGGDALLGLLRAWGWARYADGLASGGVDSLHTLAEGTSDDWRRCAVPEADARALAFAARAALRRRAARKARDGAPTLNIYATDTDAPPPPPARPEDGRPAAMPDGEWVCELEDGWREAVRRVAGDAVAAAGAAAPAGDDDGSGEPVEALILMLHGCLRRCGAGA